MNYSKWDGIGNDSDEECSRPLEPYKPDSLRSWIRESDKQLDDNRREYILNASVQTEKEHEKTVGIKNNKVPTCWTCHASDAKSRCGRCKLVFFCSKECQQNGWKTHKFQCRQTAEEEAQQIQQAEEWNELLTNRAKQEELEYGPQGKIGPIQKMITEDAEISGFKKPPMKEDGSLNFAVIIPFRQQSPLQDRGPHLQKLVAHLHTIFVQLAKWRCISRWKILVVEQADDGRPFNRGALFNAGFDFLSRSGEEFHQVVLHDVDLIADSENTKIWYAVDVPKGYIVHLTAEGYKKYQGVRALKGTLRGVVVARWDDFKESNGFPLDVWGWAEGLEDRIWMERLGALKVCYHPCPVGEWRDLDTVDLRVSPEATKEPYKHYDERWLQCKLPGEPIQLRGANGEILPGPAMPPDINKEKLLEWLINRTGGLKSKEFYKLLRDEPCHVHAMRIEVLLGIPFS